ncbi:MAG: ABC transporter substrate-binding protein [Candidatus Nealsonbacteria bacterium]|nr:ABC transporter substrate-binding protein [Candidatus Nealsonbacteria bacterium]
MLRKKRLAGALLVLVSFCLGCGKEDGSSDVPPPVTLKVGHVGHDHHLALFVAVDNVKKYAGKTGISLKTIEDRKHYELFDGRRKVADVEIVQVGGGSKMPTALAQNVIDVGLGGVAPVLAACDRGAPVKLISPLHSKGDMLVVKPDCAAGTWQEFVTLIKESKAPLRVGYKSPVAVAKLIFEDALRHEGIAFSGDLSRQGVAVQMINVKGGGKLNVALSADLIDAYVGNSPFPAIAADKGIGKIVCDLEDLPPGRFRNHPCCCLAANTNALAEKEEAIVGLIVLLLQANETINSDLDAAVKSATRWIGTSEAVERASIPTSGYCLEPDAEWHACMSVWFDAMNDLGTFEGKLKGLKEKEAAPIAYDVSLLEKARERLDAKTAED